MTPTPPRRRWFQFGLRGLLGVVTVLAAFIAYHVNWIRQQHQLLHEADALRRVTSNYISG